MDINTQLQPIVSALLADLTDRLNQEIQRSVTDEIARKFSQQDLTEYIKDYNSFQEQLRQNIAEQIAKIELSQLVDDVVKSQLSRKFNELNIKSVAEQNLTESINHIIEHLNSGIVAAANQQITDEISRKTAQLDIQTSLNTLVEKKLGALVLAGKFPAGSISHTSVDFTGLKITGNQIKGGIIERFGSTGIEDLASKVSLTVMDTASVFENSILAPEAKIKGSLTVEGNLILQGELNRESVAYKNLIADATLQVKENLNTELFQSYSDIIETNIRNKGLDLDSITQQGREVIKGNQIGYHIVDSNLQRLGVVKDFQTSGETLLSQTLYVTGRRVGVNTLDPSAALAVWDEEVEVAVGKRKQDTGYIGTFRHQRLVVGSNNKDNIVLNPDGSVEVENFSVGNTPMSSAAVIPNYEGRTGEIVWNESPSLGGPIGWVCLGSTLWAKFGRIE